MTTVKEHCCGADLVFDEKTAKKQYKKYIKNGASRITAKIIDQLSNNALADKTLVDIGGGIGALQWWFLENGGKQTFDIDASSGYLKKAKAHAESRNWLEKTNFIMGDCTEVLPQLENVDFITLDKVICCYPDYKDILEACISKSPKHITLSYPMDGVLADFFRMFGVLMMKLKNNPFRPYIHSVKEVRLLFEKNGYKQENKHLLFPWHIETFVKI